MKSTIEILYTIEELEKMFLPMTHAPRNAKLNPWKCYVINAGTQIDPAFGGIKLVFEWEDANE